MSYYSQLEYLERALAAGAVDPAEAVTSILELDKARQESRAARKQARAGALDDLITTAQEGAAAGTPMSDLRPQLASMAASSGLPQMNYGQIPQIDALYEGGVSTIKPMLDAEDTADISNRVYTMLDHRTGANAGANARTDLGAIRQQVMGQMAQLLNPDELMMLTPEIDRVVTEAYSRAVRTPSSNYMDQFIAPPSM